MGVDDKRDDGCARLGGAESGVAEGEVVSPGNATLERQELEGMGIDPATQEAINATVEDMGRVRRVLCLVGEDDGGKPILSPRDFEGEGP